MRPDHPRRLTRAQRWVWFIGAAFVCGILPVVLALTVHNHGTAADPDCVRHCYTFVHAVGPGVLGFIGAPAVISLVVAALLYRKVNRHSHSADRVAWSLAVLSCVMCFLGLLTSLGISMVPVAVLTVCAVATAP